MMILWYNILFLLLAIISSVTAQIKTNIVFILTNGQGWGDLSLNGNPRFEAPNLDKFGRSGVWLNNFYVSPLCAPSRASILAGRCHLKNGVAPVSEGLETAAFRLCCPPAGEAKALN